MIIIIIYVEKEMASRLPPAVQYPHCSLCRANAAARKRIFYVPRGIIEGAEQKNSVRHSGVTLLCSIL